jgi:predicted GNAT family acetyltransferase
MNPNYQALPLIDNTYDQQFELEIGDAMALVQYQLHQHYLTLVHTEVPPALQGQGVGSALVEKVLHLAAERQLIVIPLCPFVVRYLHQHPEWYRLVAPGYRAANAQQ